MDKVLNILKLKKLDTYMLLNYPIVWKYSLHYIILFSIFLTLILLCFVFLGFNQPLTIAFIGFILMIFLYGIEFSIKDFFYLFINDNLYLSQRKGITPIIKLSGLKQYFLDLLIGVLILLPSITTLSLMIELSSEEIKTYNDSYSIRKFQFDNSKIVYIVSEDENRSLNQEEKSFFNKLSENFLDKQVIELTEDDFIKLTSEYSRISILKKLKDSMAVVIVVFLMGLFFKIIWLDTVNERSLLGASSILFFMFFFMFFFVYLVGEINFISEFIIPLKNFIENINNYLIFIIFFVATLFIYLYKIILNELTVFLPPIGLLVYFLLFYFFFHLTLFITALFVISNMLFIISSLREKIIILNARPKK